ncbi:MAG: dioxygenase [Idiomarina sp.]|uniref:DODA-type extradiol aromatic ring-opening family dioxygenase n=1 Tax=Idiomarina sp. TaxID=1874361 RepID=UPI000C524F51|nr:class III extradiol ring-cleavage dioxygenase [Idiomarina sp.]MBT41915.1 dioxygenase [Idiomarina sp.]
MRQILYIAHGGGPMPLLAQDDSHDSLNNALRDIAARMPTPDAIVVVSAHWEADIPHVTTAQQPELIYDYYGFPPESYQISYPAPGEPGLAKELLGAITAAGIESVGEPERGFDHGLFVPLKLMFPQANIPCVQLSLMNTLDAEAHIRLGNALTHLDYDNLLILGSGFSFHNMKAFFAQGDTGADRKNAEFQQWLEYVCSSGALTEQQRSEKLSHWHEAPHARFCHPREEHLLPLHVCYGAAGRACDEVISVSALHKEARMCYWQLT